MEMSHTIEKFNIKEELQLEAGVRNKVTGEIEAIRADEIMAEVKMRGT